MYLNLCWNFKIELNLKWKTKIERKLEKKKKEKRILASQALFAQQAHTHISAQPSKQLSADRRARCSRLIHTTTFYLRVGGHGAPYLFPVTTRSQLSFKLDICSYDLICCNMGCNYIWSRRRVMNISLSKKFHSLYSRIVDVL